MQEANYSKVETFDIDFIRKAFNEGRLFITTTCKESASDLRKKRIRSIIDYVSRINDYATPKYRPYIYDIWSQILNDESLINLFFYTRYSHNRGEVNWYRVTVVVCLLREWQVYSNDITASRLHCILEGTPKPNGHYTGMSRYLLEKHHRELIRKKLQKILL